MGRGWAPKEAEVSVEGHQGDDWRDSVRSAGPQNSEGEATIVESSSV